MPKWRKEELQFLLGVVSLGRQKLGLEDPKQRDDLFLADLGGRRGTESYSSCWGDVTRMTAAGSGSRVPQIEGGFLLCEVGGRLNDTGEEQRSLGQVKTPPRLRGAVTRVESAATQDCFSSTPVDKPHGANNGGGK